MSTLPDHLQHLVVQQRTHLRASPPARGPRPGICPRHEPAAGFYCWKFPNPSPTAAWGFRWMLTYFIDPESKLSIATTNRIPLPNGELLLTSTLVDKAEIETSDYLHTIEESATHLGLVQLDQLEIEELYLGVRTTLFRREVHFVRLDLQWEVLEHRIGNSEDMPLLPPDETRRHGSTAGGDQSLLLYFPHFEPLHDAAGEVVDYALTGGVEVTPTRREALTPGRCESSAPPLRQAGPQTAGMYISIAIQEGPLKLYLEHTYVIDEQGKTHFLHTTNCSGHTEIDIIEKMRLERKGSWFKTTTKISIIRKELKLIDGWDCGAASAPVEAASNPGGKTVARARVLSRSTAEDPGAVGEKMDRCVNLLQDWRNSLVLEAPRDELRQQLRDELAELPAGTSALQAEFFDNLGRQLAGPQTRRAVVAGEKAMPVRNATQDIPGLLTAHRERDGLVHGAIITMPSFTLVCKAYIYFVVEVKNLWNHFIAFQVAGVCEQFDPAGKLIQVWHTNHFARLQPFYDSTHRQFIPTCCASEEKGLGSVLVHGHYMPEGGLEGTTEEPPRAGYQEGLFTEPPDAVIAPENPFYAPPFSDQGYQLSTPYIKIFVPDVTSPGVIVTMIGAGRAYDIAFKFSGALPNGIDRRYRNAAKFYTRTFT